MRGTGALSDGDASISTCAAGLFAAVFLLVLLFPAVVVPRRVLIGRPSRPRPAPAASKAGLFDGLTADDLKAGADLLAV
jgi:hypothetical protein